MAKMISDCIVAGSDSVPEGISDRSEMHCSKVVMECKGKWLMVAVVFNYGKTSMVMTLSRADGFLRASGRAIICLLSKGNQTSFVMIFPTETTPRRVLDDQPCTTSINKHT